MYTNNTAQPKANKNKLVIYLVLMAAVLALLTSVPAVQSYFKTLTNPHQRQVLAKVTAFIGGDQNEFLVLKVKDETGLILEIYQIDKLDAKQIYKQSFNLNQDTDTYITLDKNSTNLALSDVDKDGQPDILAPSVDRNGNLRLNTFRYNLELHQFEVLQENK